MFMAVYNFLEFNNLDFAKLKCVFRPLCVVTAVFSHDRNECCKGGTKKKQKN